MSIIQKKLTGDKSLVTFRRQNECTDQEIKYLSS